MTTELYNVNASGVPTTLAVAFDRDMIFSDEFLWHPIACSVTPTIGTGVIKSEKAISEVGRPITLEARNGYGRQSYSTVSTLKTLSEVVGAKYYLKIIDEGRTFQKLVSFRSEQEPSPVAMTPAADIDGNAVSSFPYEGTIYLMVDEA